MTPRASGFETMVFVTRIFSSYGSACEFLKKRSEINVLGGGSRSFDRENSYTKILVNNICFLIEECPVN